jgi:hypothetical protein
MSLSAEQIADLVSTTLNELGRGKWTDIASVYQEYYALPKLLKQEKVQFDSGPEIELQVMHKYGGNAKHTGLYATDDVNSEDIMAKGKIPWRHSTTNWSYDEREITMNAAPSKIVDLVKTKRAGAMGGLAELMETALWSKPASSADVTTPFGLTYWIVKYDGTGGFDGGNPTGFTSGAGNISSSTYTRWANWAAQYTTSDKADLISKMRKAYTKIQFKSPVDYPSASGADRYTIYTNYDGLAALEDIGESQNENLGRDVASMDGKIVFRGNKVDYVPYLDNDTENPYYFVNWGVFDMVFLKGEYLKETGPIPAPKQHRVKEVHVDLTWNTRCVDRRRLAVIHK